MIVLQLLPLFFLVLGLWPSWLYAPKEEFSLALGYLVASLLMASTATLYARAPVGPRTRPFWVLALALTALGLSFQASDHLVELPENIRPFGLAAFMASCAAFLMALFRQHHETLVVAKLSGPAYTESQGIMKRSALTALAYNLEAVAARHPVMLILVQTQSSQGARIILETLRGSDLMFKVDTDRYLLVLQQGGAAAAPPVFHRLKEKLPQLLYAALPYQGGSIRRALEQLEAELDQSSTLQPEPPTET
ncbi:MAG: hypothetical protein M1157_03250 [Deinococcus sp.]|nr:hypothetical protein [Deinococcus sp.]